MCDIPAAVRQRREGSQTRRSKGKSESETRTCHHFAPEQEREVQLLGNLDCDVRDDWLYIFPLSSRLRTMIKTFSGFDLAYIGEVDSTLIWNQTAYPICRGARLSVDVIFKSFPNFTRHFPDIGFGGSSRLTTVVFHSYILILGK